MSISKYIKNVLSLKGLLKHYPNNIDNLFLHKKQLVHVANYYNYYDNAKLVNNLQLIISQDKNINKFVIIWSFIYQHNNFIPIIIDKYKNKHKSKSFYNCSYNIDHQWVSASKTRNYLIDDPILDYLEYNNIYEPNDLLSITNHRTTSNKRKFSDISENNPTFLSTILNNGTTFEHKIMEKLIQEYSNDIVTVLDNNNHHLVQDPNFSNITIELMKLGIPIIYQGVLHDTETKTYGLPDLIIRSDYINKLFDVKIDVCLEKLNSTNQLPYYIIDIKNSNIHLASKSDNVLNFQNSKPFKGQISIYHQILTKIQKFDTNKAFILASKWTRKQKDNVYQCSNPFDRLGVLEFNLNDKEYIKTSQDAIKWIQLIRDENNGLNCLNPNNSNLYPNMCNTNDGRFKKIKRYLADKNHEITNIWMCSTKHRKKAIEHGITKWSDPRLNSNLLGINGNNAKIVDLIINMNRDSSDLIYPNRITSTFNNWRDKEGLSFYIDFETLNTTMFKNREWFDVEVNNVAANDIIFMIGIGYSYKSKWHYKSFIAPNLTDNNQIKIINNMIKYIKKISKKYKVDDQNVNLYHWSNFEPIIMTKLCTKHNIMLPIFKWTDILKIFHEEPIIVKGAFDFSLKSIGKAMYQNKLITVTWDNGLEIENGLDAMFYAYQLYQKEKKTKIIKKMENIRKYNEIDCKIMWDILNTLRLKY